MDLHDLGLRRSATTQSLSTPLAQQCVRDALLIPLGQPYAPGVYDRAGQLVRAAAYFRGLPYAHFPLEDQNTNLGADAVPFAPDGPEYVFAGHLTGHYGHFLFAMLGRLWSLPRPVPRNVQIVLLNGIHARDLFELDFARSIFEALGLTLENFASFREPVRFHELLVPSPAIEESLSVGVHRISNENALCEILRQRGVEIISPELLSFRAQIELWRTRTTVMGMAGSMMHTSIFVPRRRYAALNPEPWINSNQVILDKINENVAVVLHPREGCAREVPSGGFDNIVRLPDPMGAALDLLHEAQNVAHLS